MFCNSDTISAVAAGDDFKARAAQAKGAFRHEQNALALIFAEANTGCQLRTRVWIGDHRSDLSGWNEPGGGQPG
jgi:hypothetical protein